MKRRLTEEALRTGRLIRTLRQEQHWTVKDVARHVSIHPRYLGQVEQGFHLPGNEVRLRLESFFHVPPGTFSRPPQKIRHLGDLIRQMRVQRGWTQEQLGAKVGLTDGAISGHETGRFLPDLEILERLAKAFEIDVSHFTPFMIANIPDEHAMWTHIVVDGVLRGEKACIAQIPPRVYKPLPDDYPEPVWTTFEHLPAQWFPRGRLQLQSQ